MPFDSAPSARGNSEPAGSGPIEVRCFREYNRAQSTRIEKQMKARFFRSEAGSFDMFEKMFIACDRLKPSEGSRQRKSRVRQYRWHSKSPAAPLPRLNGAAFPNPHSGRRWGAFPGAMVALALNLSGGARLHAFALEWLSSFAQNGEIPVVRENAVPTLPG